MADDQKVALVLGGIKGIGKGIGLDLIDNGVKVALTYHDWEEFLPETPFHDNHAFSVTHFSMPAGSIPSFSINSLSGSS